MTFTIIFMGSGRHIYRANALEPHRKMVAANTAEFQRLSKEARENPVLNEELPALDSSLGLAAKGAAIFEKNCSSCHKADEKLVGPPISEMKTIYEKDRAGLKEWIKAPGKKRADYPQMPGFAQLSDEDREELANFILNSKK